MLSPINKVAIENSETHEKDPVFPVYKSPLQLMNQTETANAADKSKVQFNITTPSLDSYVDDNIFYTLEGLIRLDVKVNGNIAVDQHVITPGSTFSLREFFLHRMMQTASVRINEQSITTEMSEVLNELIQLSSSEKLRKYSTSGYRLPTYAKMADAGNTNGSTYSGLASSGGADQSLGVGSYVNYVFCDPSGAELSTISSQSPKVLGTGVYPSAIGGNISYKNGIPVSAVQNGSTKVYDIYLKVRVTERLLMEPFSGNTTSTEMGFKNLRSMNLQFNLKSDLSGCFAFPNGDSNNVRHLNSQPILENQKWSEAKIEYITRIPSITTPVKEINMKPYYHIVRQNQVFSNPNIPANGTKNFRLGAFPISQVFEYMLISVKKTNYDFNTSTAENDFFLPVSNVSIDFDGSASLLSTLSTEQLYHLSLKNGIETNYPQFTGEAYQGVPGQATGASGKVQTYGSCVLLKASDLPMASGVGANVGGRFVVNPTVTVKNVNDSAINSDISVNVLYFNRGYLVSQNGRTTALLDVLSSSDVMTADQLEDVIDTEDLEMMYGGSFFSSLKSGLSKVGKFVTNPLVKKIVKGSVNLAGNVGGPKAKRVTEKIKKGFDVVGYGQGGQVVSGGEMVTGGVSTGGSKNKKMNLSDLM